MRRSCRGAFGWAAAVEQATNGATMRQCVAQGGMWAEAVLSERPVAMRLACLVGRRNAYPSISTGATWRWRTAGGRRRRHGQALATPQPTRPWRRQGARPCTQVSLAEPGLYYAGQAPMGKVAGCPMLDCTGGAFHLHCSCRRAALLPCLLSCAHALILVLT